MLRRPRCARALLAALLGFALAFQALVVSVHVHPLSEVGVAAAPVRAPDDAPGVPKVHDELNCPLCLVLKSGASYVPPAPPTLALSWSAATIASPPAARATAPAFRSPAQPRAPPVLV